MEGKPFPPASLARLMMREQFHLRFAIAALAAIGSIGSC
jgi:hypothetical protein